MLFLRQMVKPMNLSDLNGKCRLISKAGRFVLLRTLILVLPFSLCGGCLFSNFKPVGNLSYPRIELKNGGVSVCDQKFTELETVEDFIQLMGEPNRTRNINDIYDMYIWDNCGVVLRQGKQGKLVDLIAIYIDPIEGGFITKEKFTGQLKWGAVTVSVSNNYTISALSKRDEGEGFKIIPNHSESAILLSNTSYMIEFDSFSENKTISMVTIMDSWRFITNQFKGASKEFRESWKALGID